MGIELVRKLKFKVMEYNKESFDKAIEENMIIRWHKNFEDVVKSYLKFENERIDNQ